MVPHLQLQLSRSFRRLLFSTAIVWSTLAQGQSLLVENLNDSGPGSLRAQITIANSNSNLSIVEFADDLSGVIAISSPLQVSQPIQIRARAQSEIVIDGQDAVRVFSMTGAPVLQPHVLDGLTIRNGRASLGGANVRVFGSLQLLNCVLSGGQATANNGSNNNANNADGGGLFHSGGELFIADCLFEDNATIGGFSQGGGLYTERGTATMLRSRVIGNTTDGFVGEGGGVASRSTMLISDCEISGNETLGRSSGGGGIFTDSLMTIIQTTLSQNVVGVAPDTGISGYSVGGAFANVGSGGASFESCTITGNVAPTGDGQGSGVSSISRGLISFRNCIVAGNIGGSDVDETFNRRINYRDDGFNIFGDVATTVLAQNSNQASSSQYEVEDPMLGPLGFFGGVTQSHLPLAGSPAIDGGSPLLSSSPLIDQRGADFPRLVGESLDVGAIEDQRMIDENNNGLPDAVESIVEGLESSNGDLDGDGASDSDEFLFLGVAAISDAAVKPQLTLVREASTATAFLQFPTSPNREYRLLASPDLELPFSPLNEEFVPFELNGQGSFEQAITDDQNFFQIEARIPPSF